MPERPIHCRKQTRGITAHNYTARNKTVMYIRVATVPVIIIVKMKTRSTPRAQTPAAHNLSKVKQSSYAWNSLPQKCSLVYVGSVTNTWKTIHVVSHKVPNRPTHKQTNKRTDWKYDLRRSAEVTNVETLNIADSTSDPPTALKENWWFWIRLY